MISANKCFRDQQILSVAYSLVDIPVLFLLVKPCYGIMSQHIPEEEIGDSHKLKHQNVYKGTYTSSQFGGDWNYFLGLLYYAGIWLGC